MQISPMLVEAETRLFELENPPLPATSAIHVNVPSEISVITEKDPPLAADLMVIEDTADLNNKKRVQLGNWPGGATIDDSGNITTTGVVNIGTSPPAIGDDLNVAGSMDLVHTAAENDDHAIEIDCDAAAFGDVKALDIDYITGAIATGESEEVILINIDETSAVGGDVSAVEILATEGAADMVNALFVGVTINPVEQLSGTFANAAVIDDNGTDELTALSSGGAGNVAVFTNNSEYLIVGSAAKFEELEIIVDTGSSGAGIKPTFEFSTGVGTWSTFSPADGTNGIRNTGVMAWLDSDIPSWATGAGTKFLIRITRTRVNLTTTPIIDKVQIAAATLYSWDKNGDQIINNLSLSGKISLGFGDIVSEQNPDAVDAIRIKGTSSDIDIVIGGTTDFFSVWNTADDTPVFFVNNVGDTDILGDATITGNILISGTVDGRDVAADGTKLDTISSNAIANVLDDTTPQLGGELDCQARSIGGELQTYTGDGTTTVDFRNGQNIKFTFGAQNDTWTTTAPSEPGVFLVYIIQDGTGGRTLTLPATWKFAGGTQPTLSTGSAAVDIFSVTYDGTNFFMGTFMLDAS